MNESAKSLWQGVVPAATYAHAVQSTPHTSSACWAMLDGGEFKPCAGDAALVASPSCSGHSQQVPLAGSQLSPSGLNAVQGAGEGGACRQHVPKVTTGCRAVCRCGTAVASIDRS
jgi:hypothetical protein